MMESRSKRKGRTQVRFGKKWIIGSLFGGIAALLILILTGIFAPRPKGVLIGSEENIARSVSSYSQMEDPVFLQIELPENATSIDILADFALRENFAANAEAGIGIEADRFEFQVTLSTSGYLTLYQDGQPLLPAAPFPHIRLDGGQNELWLHLEADGTCAIRINREIAWVGRIELDGDHSATGSVDLFEQIRPAFVAISRDSDAVIEIVSYSLYSSSR